MVYSAPGALRPPSRDRATRSRRAGSWYVDDAHRGPSIRRAPVAELSVRVVLVQSSCVRSYQPAVQAIAGLIGRNACARFTE
jgi:hypothetical protein